MTDQGDPLTRRHAYASRPVTRRRNKLAPDPDVRRAIVAAASKTVREQGVQGLSVAAVLDRAQLSTRAFYRHFESKDQLVAALFLEVTRNEVLRLRTKMAAAPTPAAAVAAWIEGRLDLAFDEDIDSELRQVALEAQAAMSSSPELVSPAYNAILEPLIEQLQRGLELGVFRDILPATAAKSIHGVVWGHTHRQRATGQPARADVRNRALRFCLRGLGVPPETIAQILAGGGA
ncbi:TetR/AcrR family transcriptional regulator [Mycobacterium sp. IS-836]|uniref:TetR/AcrR family transcriptional regulator n=1 Tax=Mycobacterium sp. IS-836 TaxID=1834160 RepID=UPI0011511F67|nr:TetR/AcrR family transcriptional regulator [Mycobacterium sp. IS-836]